MLSVLDDEIRLATDALVTKLRASVPSETKKGSWMKFLDDRQLTHVYLLLKKGNTNSEVIHFARKEFGVGNKLGVPEMLPELVKFRTEALNDTNLIQIEAQAGNEVAQQLEDKMNKLSSELDGLGRFGWLIDLQTKRVLRLHERELKTLPMSITTDNVKLLGGMLKEYIDKQIELGIISSNVPKIKLEVDGNFKNLLEALSDDGERMIQATHRFLDLAEKKALTMSVSDDGTYKIEKELGDVVTEASHTAG